MNNNDDDATATQRTATTVTTTTTKAVTLSKEEIADMRGVREKHNKKHRNELKLLLLLSFSVFFM